MIIKNKADLCEYLGEPIDSTEEHLSRVIYKTTECGGWLRLTDTGIEIGTMVEGCDAEFFEKFNYPFSTELYETVWQNIEFEAEAAWRDANEDDFAREEAGE